MPRGNTFAYDREQANNYRRYDTDTSYSYDPGVMVLPVASETPTTVTVRYHGGHGKRVVSFNAVKGGNPPILPAPDDTDKDTLVGVGLSIPNPIPDKTNNGYVWSVSGTYTYVTNDAPRIPGEDYFPALGYPYPLPQDDVAAAMLRGTDLDSIKSNIQSSDFDRGTYMWPFTVLPDIFFNSQLVY